MLDDYQKEQPIIYRILKNAIIKDECSHAYLFETGNYSKSSEFIKAFVKALICPNHHMNVSSDCRYCHLVETDNFPEIKVINPDGFWIKKDALIALQEEFNKKPIMGDRKVYIINGADKLNKQSANSILKFIEEPDNNITALLVTDNLYSVMPTIRSRCQILSFQNVKQTFPEQFQTTDKITSLLYRDSEADNTEKINKAIEFVNYYEKNHLNTILYMNKLWHDYQKNKEDCDKAFEIMILYYKDILSAKLNRKISIFTDEVEQLNKIANQNTIENICTKINIIMELKQNIKYNANLNLLMDKLVIKLEGGI